MSKDEAAERREQQERLDRQQTEINRQQEQADRERASQDSTGTDSGQ